MNHTETFKDADKVSKQYDSPTWLSVSSYLCTAGPDETGP